MRFKSPPLVRGCRPEFGRCVRNWKERSARKSAAPLVLVDSGRYRGKGPLDISYYIEFGAVLNKKAGVVAIELRVAQKIGSLHGRYVVGVGLGEYHLLIPLVFEIDVGFANTLPLGGADFRVSRFGKDKNVTYQIFL